MPSALAITVDLAGGVRVRIDATASTALVTVDLADAAMIPVPTGVRIWIATDHTNMRKCMQGLALLVQEGLGRDPFAGDVFGFRGLGGSLLKALRHYGIGWAAGASSGRRRWMTSLP
jgi:transposase